MVNAVCIFSPRNCYVIQTYSTDKIYLLFIFFLVYILPRTTLGLRILEVSWKIREFLSWELHPPNSILFIFCGKVFKCFFAGILPKSDYCTHVPAPVSSENRRPVCTSGVKAERAGIDELWPGANQRPTGCVAGIFDFPVKPTQCRVALAREKREVRIIAIHLKPL